MTTLWALVKTGTLTGLLYAPLALGLSVSFRVINFPDLTCEGAAIFAGVTAIMTLNATGSVVLSFALAAIAGIIAGVSTGFINRCCGVSRLLSGIASAGIFYSITMRLLRDRASISADNPTLFQTFNPGGAEIGQFIVTAVSCTLIVGILICVFRTKSGLVLRSLGDNERYVVTLGKNPRQYTLLGLGVANGIIGFGTALVAHYGRVCNASLGPEILVGTLAAIVVGESLFASRRMWCYFLFCVLGSIVFNTASSVVFFKWHNWIDNTVAPTDVRLVTGLLLIVPGLLLLRKTDRYRLFNSDW